MISTDRTRVAIELLLPTHSFGSLLCQVADGVAFRFIRFDGVPVPGAVTITPPVGCGILTAPALRQVGRSEEPAAV